jgi:hypothetical protein
MAYVTICEECLAQDHEHCSQSKLKPESARIQEYNDAHPDDFMVGGGVCVCRHGGPEGSFERSIRQQTQASRALSS